MDHIATNTRGAGRYARTTRLVVSSDQSYIGSVIVALDANHIPHVDLPGGSPWNLGTAVMVREMDVRRAREAIADLQRTTMIAENPEARWWMIALLALILLGVAIGIVPVVAQWFRS